MTRRESLLGFALLAYWPTWYLAFYLPWIVPRLPGLRAFPIWVYGFVLLFAIGLALLGATSSSTRAAIWATVIGGAIALLNLGLTIIQAPGFLKHHEPDVLTLLLLFAAYILGCLALVALGGAARWVVLRARAT